MLSSLIVKPVALAPTSVVQVPPVDALYLMVSEPTADPRVRVAPPTVSTLLTNALPKTLSCEPMVVEPVLVTVNSVVCAPVFEVDAIEKSVVVALVDAAKMLKSAVGAGVEDPMVRPLRNAAASKSEVDDA